MNTHRESQLRTPVRSQTEDQSEPIVAAGEPEAPVGPTARPSTPADEAAPPRPDAGQLHPDANQPRPETSQPQPEADQPRPETGQPRPEADQTQPEADDPQPEADQPQPDAAKAAQVDFEALNAKAEKAEEYLALAQRTQADFENYRRRAVRDAAAAQERGVAKLAKALLPAVDNLDRALAAAAQDGNGEDGTLASGIKLVHADVITALARMGIEPFSPEGEPFDPQWHEAVSQQPVEGTSPGTVVEVYQRGYRLGDNVLRPARVVVAG